MAIEGEQEAPHMEQTDSTETIQHAPLSSSEGMASEFRADGPVAASSQAQSSETTMQSRDTDQKEVQLVDGPTNLPKSRQPLAMSDGSGNLAPLTEGEEKEADVERDHGHSGDYFMQTTLRSPNLEKLARPPSTSAPPPESTSSLPDDIHSPETSPALSNHASTGSNRTSPLNASGPTSHPDTTRPTSTPIYLESRSNRRGRDGPEYPSYPNQSFASLQSQHYSPTHQPHPLRTRNSHPSQNSSFSSEPSRKSRDFPTMISGARTVGNTPAQSPGLYSPTFPSRRSLHEEEGEYGTPLLHPSHGQTPIETHKLNKDYDPLTGNKRLNNYEVLEKLGSGQHGTVKLGRNLDTGELVAVKIVRRFSKKRRLGRIEDPSDLVRKEIAILKKARHPHVVSLLEVIDDDKAQKVYLILEYVERGEIVWRKQTDKDTANFEMNRVKREKGNQHSSDFEFAEIDRFNSTAPARRAERERLKKEEEDRAAQRRDTLGSRHRRPISEPSSFWSLEHESEDEHNSEPLSRQGSDLDMTEAPAIGEDLQRASETAHEPENPPLDIEEPRTPTGPINSTPLEAETSNSPEPHRSKDDPLSDLEATEASTLSTMVQKQRDGPAKPPSDTTFDLEGPTYGPYDSDENHPDTTVKATFEQLVAGHNHWSMEEDEFKHVPCLTMHQALDVFRDTVLGLEYLHYQGIIHRDIKPANLLWTHDFCVKISDFGVSYLGKPIRQNDMQEEIPEADPSNPDEAIELAKTVGSPAFYAPELCDPDLFDSEKTPNRPQITGQIDVWALGVSLYGMIYGRLPFIDDNQFALFEKIARQETFISRWRLKGVEHTEKAPMNSNKRLDDIIEYEEVDDEIQDLLKRLLHKDPTKRISLREVKHHSWLLRGIKDKTAWVKETDPSWQSEGKKIEVSTEEVQEAVVGINLFGLFKQGITSIKRLGSVVRGRDRKRGDSNPKAPETPPSSSTSKVSLSGREGRRASLRGDEQTYTASRPSRDPSEHPLAQSVAASPEAQSSTGYFDDGGTEGPAMARDGSDADRPGLPERTLSNADSTRTIRPPIPSFIRNRSRSPAGGFPLMPTVLDANVSSNLGGIFGGAGRRFVNSMRSRERGRGRESPSHSSRSSSADTSATSNEDSHASPSIAMSSAFATGHVDQPPVLYEEAEEPTSSTGPGVAPATVPSDPGEKSGEAFKVAQEKDYHQHIPEHPRSADHRLRAASSVSAADVACPPSPDEEHFFDQRPPQPHSDDTTPFGISSSSDQIGSTISESFSHPSIPSVVSGASSLSATVEAHDELPLCKIVSPASTALGLTPTQASEYSTQSAAITGLKPSFDEREAGYNGDGESDSDSDDGLAMAAC